jgi:hypothetical protein
MSEAIPFKMKRNHDCNGVSGEGWVCVGVIFPSGRVSTEWTVEGKPNSNGFYSSFGDFLAIHVFSHPDNQTEIWTDQYSPIEGTGDLPWLMAKQEQFEDSLVGTDGSLRQHNTAEYALKRGVIGEAEEALESLEEGDIEGAKLEAVDVLIFLSTLFNHLNVTYDEVLELGRKKMATNFSKYRPEYFAGMTVDEGVKKSRDLWTKGTLSP